MSVTVTVKHASHCRQETPTLWQRSTSTSWRPIMLVERYRLLDGGEAIYLTCANCAHTSAFRITVEGKQIPLEGIDVYGIPTEFATVT